MDVREPCDRPVGEAEQATVAEPVEPVLRAEADGDTAERPRRETVEVGMDEVRVEDVRPARADGANHARERPRARRAREPKPMDRDARRLEPLRQFLGARLALVEHRELDLEPLARERGQ